MCGFSEILVVVLMVIFFFFIFLCFFFGHGHYGNKKGQRDLEHYCFRDIFNTN